MEISFHNKFGELITVKMNERRKISVKHTDIEDKFIGIEFFLCNFMLDKDELVGISSACQHLNLASKNPQNIDKINNFYKNK